MISGRFGENGELFFEIELIASNGDRSLFIKRAIALPFLHLTNKKLSLKPIKSVAQQADERFSQFSRFATTLG
jgi:hypothetical protein